MILTKKGKILPRKRNIDPYKDLAEEVILQACADLDIDYDGELKKIEKLDNEIKQLQSKNITRKMEKRLGVLFHKKYNSIHRIKNFHKTIKWFDARSKEPNGYFFWLEIAELNGNAIKKYVNLKRR